MFKLLSQGKANTKIGKNKNEDYLIFSLNLKPAETEVDGKVYDVCPFRTESCTQSCVGNNGHFSMENGSARKAQVRKTESYFRNTKSFYEDLDKDIAKAIGQAKKRNATAVFRLNAYSDIDHHKQSRRYLGTSLHNKYDNALFYDYTKSKRRTIRDNYSVTYSHNEDVTLEYSASKVRKGENVAIVFEEIPTTFMGLPVFNGDKDDNRFLDPKGHWIGLKFKGSNKKKLEAIAKGFCIPKY